MKKLISHLLCIAMACALVLIGSVQAEELPGLVDGKIVEGFLDHTDDEGASYSSGNEAPANIPDNLSYSPFSSLSEGLLALEGGRISYFGVPACCGKYIAVNNPELTAVFSEQRGDCFDFRMATRAEDNDLCSSINSALAVLQSDGTLDKLIAQYITGATSSPESEVAVRIDGVPSYAVGVTGDFPPFDYASVDGKAAGFNVALLNALSQAMNVNFETVCVASPARTMALSAKKIDVVFWMGFWRADAESYIPENDTLAFTDVYFSDGYCIVTRDFPASAIYEAYGLQ